VTNREDGDAPPDRFAWMIVIMGSVVMAWLLTLAAAKAYFAKALRECGLSQPKLPSTSVGSLFQDLVRYVDRKCPHPVGFGLRHRLLCDAGEQHLGALRCGGDVRELLRDGLALDGCAVSTGRRGTAPFSSTAFKS
jgi:hypothetical protein